MLRTLTRAPLTDLIAHTFPSCAGETILALEAEGEVREFAQDEVIARQGSPSFVAIMIEGYVALYRTATDGRQLLVALSRSGEIAALSGMSNLAILGDVVALMPCRLVVWPGRFVRTLAEHDAGLALDAFDDVMHWAEGVMGRLEGLHSQNAQRRVARVLYDYRELFFRPRALLTTRHLPGIVGTTREMTGRVLREFSAAGLISRTGHGRLALLDGSRLQALADRDDEPEGDWGNAAVR